MGENGDPLLMAAAQRLHDIVAFQNVAEIRRILYGSESDFFDQSLPDADGKRLIAMIRDRVGFSASANDCLKHLVSPSVSSKMLVPAPENSLFVEVTPVPKAGYSPTGEGFSSFQTRKEPEGDARKAELRRLFDRYDPGQTQRIPASKLYFLLLDANQARPDLFEVPSFTRVAEMWRTRGGRDQASLGDIFGFAESYFPVRR